MQSVGVTLAFDPRDPFPLLEERELAYAEAQEHAALADAWLDLRAEAVERTLPRGALAGTGQQLWLDLPVRGLLTPYVELRALLARLRPVPGSTVVDLGAGYGRLGFVVARHWPGVSFLGYEYVRERVAEGNRCLAAHGHALARLECVDLSAREFRPGAAGIYFLYDYGTRAAIEKTLQDLRHIARTLPLTVVGRGRASRDAIERRHPWLSQVVPPEHAPHASIYRTRAA